MILTTQTLQVNVVGIATYCNFITRLVIVFNAQYYIFHINKESRENVPNPNLNYMCFRCPPGAVVTTRSDPISISPLNFEINGVVTDDIILVCKCDGYLKAT